MRILHTSDWHLGKYLEKYSRLEEQELFLEELELIVAEEKIDFILIAGDIYDTANPPALAEQLFYKSIKKLSNNSKIPILIIAGNHDNPERLVSINPFATESGIIILGTLKTIIPTGEYEHFSIIDSGKGYLELKINNEKIIVVTMPFPSEKRLEEIIIKNEDEKDIQTSYSEKISEIFLDLSKKFRDDSINLIVGHFFIIGGESSASEREIQLGGSYAVNGFHLPNADYIAMGHLHKSQKIKCSSKYAYYSGSPIQYSKSEANYAKCVYIVDIEAQKEAVVNKRYLKNYKPIEIWKLNSIEEALERCKASSSENTWVFMEIKTDRPLLQEELREMKILKSGIIEIMPIYSEHIEILENQIFEEKSFSEEFSDFYKSQKKVSATKELLELFLEIYEDDE